MNSQNNETQIILEYFSGRTGTVLDIGANDGLTFSNSYDLIQAGWYGILFEPGHVYDQLHALHKGNGKVHTHRLGIGEREEIVKFWQSGPHVKNGIDQGLVSTMHEHETHRWRKAGVKFKEIEIELVPFSWVASKYPVFDCISIDCEGMDWTVLKQINPIEVSCKCIVIEWNSERQLEKLYHDYLRPFGFKEISRNAENLIFAI